MSCVFNIIYTPGTTFLVFFAHSLLRWSDCSFRLVTNHCAADEARTVQEFCRRDPRLEFYQLPDTGDIAPHESALNHLHSLTATEKFCFLDSDIFANGAWQAHFAPYAATHAAAFAGAPVWCRPQEQVLPTDSKIMAGEYHRTADGRCLGGTYCALYDHQLLAEFRREQGFLFEPGHWAQMSDARQKQLCAIGLAQDYYDTGKLLNIGLAQQGHKLAWAETETLRHLGGVSYVPLKRDAAVAQRQQAKQRLRRAPWQAGPLLYRRAQRELQKRLRPQMFDQSGKLSFSVRRDVYSFYFADLLAALHENAPLPHAPKCGEPDVEQRIANVTQELVREWGSEGVGSNAPRR